MKKIWSSIAVVGLLAGPASGDDSLSGQEIVKRSVERNQIGLESGQAIMQMKIRTPKGEVLTRKLLLRASSKRGLARVRMTFIEPQDQRGIEILMLEQSGGADLQYLYLPSFKKVRRIMGSAKNGRFEGSDFTYADMENRNLEDGTYQRLADEMFAGQEVYRVDVTPQKSAQEMYSLVQMWISKKAWLPLKVVFHNLQGKRYKELKVRRLKKVKGRYIVTRALMKNLLRGSETDLSIVEINGDISFADRLFTPGSLGK